MTTECPIGSPNKAVQDHNDSISEEVGVKDNGKGHRDVPVSSAMHES